MPNPQEEIEHMQPAQVMGVKENENVLTDRLPKREHKHETAENLSVFLKEMQSANDSLVKFHL